MKKVILGALLFLFFLFYYTIKHHDENDHIIYGECKQNESVINSRITFVVDANLISLYGRDNLKNKIDEFVTAANNVLHNSCIPIRRNIDKIMYVSLDNNMQTEKDYTSLYQNIIGNMPLDDKKDMIKNPSKVIVVLINKLPDNSTGHTFPHTINKIAAISMDASIFTMEHELGHLALAGHEEGYGTDDYNPAIAHGYKCGPYRSIMNENLSDGKLAPFYSSPEISVNGESCGNVHNANNAEQLRRWSRLLKRKMEIYLLNNGKP